MDEKLFLSHLFTLLTSHTVEPTTSEPARSLRPVRAMNCVISLETRLLALPFLFVCTHCALTLMIGGSSDSELSHEVEVNYLDTGCCYMSSGSPRSAPS
jgi:hypothetical protein